MLLKRLNASGKLHMVPASLNDRFVIRFCVCAERATDRDISIAFDHIRHATEQLLSELKACTFPLMFFFCLFACAFASFSEQHSRPIRDHRGRDDLRGGGRCECGECCRANG